MNNNNTKRRHFVLSGSRVYVPGSLPAEEAVAKRSGGGGCCGVSEPAPKKDSGCGVSFCGSSAPTSQPTSCCG